MSDNISDLFGAVEREQAALVTLVEANLKAEAEDNPETMIERQRQMQPIMQRLGEATERLVLACQSGIPADMAPKIQEWQAQIAALLGALNNQTGRLSDRRALIQSTVQRLRQATRGVAGYRQTPPDRGAPRFVKRKA